MPVESKQTVPFYRPGYVQKNLAPDKIPESRIANLAVASRGAVSKGVIQESDLMNLLAMSLLEGRMDYGSNNNEYNAPKGSKNRNIVEALFGRIPLAVPLTPEEVVRNAPIYGIANSPDKKVFDKLKATGDYDTVYTAPLGLADIPQHDAAKQMILKYAIEKAKDPSRAIERYNGAGPAARKYVDLVEGIKQSLQQPQNKQLMDLYNMLSTPVGDE